MKIFYCDNCKHRVFFDNVSCTSCGSKLAFLPDLGRLAVLREADSQGTFGLLQGDTQYRLCQNAVEHGVCTWGVPLTDQQPFCRACRLNLTIPDLSLPEAKEAWEQLERAKRWLICNLLSVRLPLPDKLDPNGHGLRFSFKATTQVEQVFTGQSDGEITINIAEADDPFREKARKQLGETYRTLLGHFRHEIGHYYWDRLIKDSPRIDAYRALFGDERVSYDEARQRHYGGGAPNDWTGQFVSAYASMHPWEDWAETWAHLLHIIDTLETARAHNLVVDEKTERGDAHTVEAAAVDSANFDQMLAAWVPLTIALNSLNRSMGLSDVYPFVLSEPALVKLRFVHGVILEAARQPAAVPAPAPNPPAPVPPQV